MRTHESMSPKQREMLRKKMAGWAESADVSDRLRAASEPAHAAQAVADALELWELHPELFDLPRTANELRESAAVACAWQRLRSNWVG